MNILAADAHPDDVELGCFGALLEKKRNGDNAYAVALAPGANGGHRWEEIEEVWSRARAILKKGKVPAECVLGKFPTGRLQHAWDTVGLSTTEACGDCVRNIINCPVSGVDGRELYDTADLIREVNGFFVGNREFSNLPRKFKIAITGCDRRCVYPEINDIGIFAVEDPEDGVRFRARVGGGLSTTPRFSKDLGVLVGPEEVVELCAAIAAVFRDEGNRDNRKRARLKFLVEKWQVPRFRDEVEARLGRKLRLATEPDAEPVTERDRSHLGIHPQREPGFNYVGISIPGGRTSGYELNRLASLAEQYGRGRVRTTNTQNIVLLDVPDGNVGALKRELGLDRFDYNPNWARKGIIACTGIQFCKLAIAETKNRAAQLDAHLANAVEMDDPVRISVTGCPNSCGQHHICDVGLEGSLTTIDGVKRETFQVFLGGGVGMHETFGRRIGVRIPSEELAESLARLFTEYKERRVSGETFQEFCLRHSNERLAEYLVAPTTGAVSAPDLLTAAEFVNLADENG